MTNIWTDSGIDIKMITSDAVTNDKQSETSSSDCRDKADERCKSAVVTTLSDEEFQRLQEQLLELKNRNYELIEENKRQQNYINALPSRTTTIDSLNFATKVPFSIAIDLSKVFKGLQLIGRRKDREGVNEKLEHEILILRSKLSSQEEEFRLQQSTLLSELNKVISQCESLENELKQKNANSNEPKGTLPSNAELSQPTTNSDNAKAQADKIVALQGEITHFKAVLAEKDALCADIEALRKDLMASRKDCEQQLAESKKQLFEAMQRLEDAQRCNADLEVSLKTKNDEIIRLSSSLQEAEKNVELEEKNTETICSLTEAVDKLNKECDELRKTHKEDVDAKDELSNEVAALKASLHHSEVTWKKSLDNLKSEVSKSERNDYSCLIFCYFHKYG
ncbi:unnamed protein product [Anisakis simplex]|uniref:Cnn_1N domain-containing protein n=1 Tax=Anisakis simplex TaxID=6269 RepID=A0A0M3KAD3_ANISI|nr:unnamed protein product [Anisakis simplex]